MKTTIGYEIFYIFQGVYFWKPLYFEWLMLERYSKYNL